MIGCVETERFLAGITSRRIRRSALCEDLESVRRAWVRRIVRDGAAFCAD